MNFHELQELIKLINKSNLTEFKFKDKDVEVQIKTDKYQKTTIQTVAAAPAIQMAQVPTLQPAVQTMERQDAPAAQPAEQAPKGSNLIEIKSPIVGTFYRSQSPDKPPFIKVGDPVKQGDVVCIIEAMKLFNEIESEISGTVVKVLVEDASPVEYDQVLFLVEA
ncbi:MAG TPA: acetyl-CoA carboxylase biotin carboxyl carrier protein [Saprospiraceae bacterium]|jgi:acetyl-CoA carboxylase biotin carboxyl carrier protein|nr:acetyl-CoA carboxylase biotin carboxyl carrier protein [Saprospiraceae bacterium]HRO08057.1 acetyl-CoA carboxylase biotin carboxyl carrier protein [Saprospiraceae bacterium]HRP41356.1 acetyl-CoA carboxylase biotin carboxyl carrier protein [Saprospiraceae bacterium]